jgi:hypothetical protein
MPLELAAVAFDGAYTAERELNNLRVSRLDPWVGEIAVLEHFDVGIYSRLLLGAVGAMAGLAFGVVRSPQPTGASVVLDDLAKAVLPADASALILLAESPATEEFVSAVAPDARQVIRQELTADEQIEWLRLVKWLRLTVTGK